jgi:hypothetical protein
MIWSKPHQFHTNGIQFKLIINHNNTTNVNTIFSISIYKLYDINLLEGNLMQIGVKLYRDKIIFIDSKELV